MEDNGHVIKNPMPRIGEKAIVPPPKTLKEMEERIEGVYEEKVDFYLMKTSV